MVIAGVLLPCVPAVINVSFGYGIVTFSPMRCGVAVQDVGFCTEALAEGVKVATLGTLQAIVFLKLTKVRITTVIIYCSLIQSYVCMRKNLHTSLCVCLACCKEVHGEGK